MITLPFEASHVQIKSLLFCYLPRKRKEMAGDRRVEGDTGVVGWGWVGQRDTSYQDNLLTAVRCNLCLNKHRATLCMTPETLSPPAA